MPKKRLLLHSCCGPCSSAVLERLYEDYGITVYYYNPHIYPAEEYTHRLQTQKQIIDSLPFGAEIALVEGEYNPDMFDALAAGYEECPEGGDRCRLCFEMRLSGAAKYAAKNGFDCFTTTLSVSPHKNASLLNDIGERLSARYDIPWVFSDFKKKDGYLRSIQLSKEYGLYRQDYCGCKYSLQSRDSKS